MLFNTNDLFSQKITAVTQIWKKITSKFQENSAAENTDAVSGIISNAEFKSELETILPHCQNLTVISAFMTRPALSWLNKLIIKNKPTVTLVGRFTPSDFVKDISSLRALQVAVNKGYTVKALADLHAKIYQIDEHIFTGSANFTGKWLAIDCEGNLEACHKIPVSDKSTNFINEIINSATELTAETLNRMDDYISDKDASKNFEELKAWPAEIFSHHKSASEPTTVMEGY
ncbi:MAG: hypothetical protein ACRC24_03660 [Vibrionaceae bacterium]